MDLWNERKDGCFRRENEKMNGRGRICGMRGRMNAFRREDEKIDGRGWICGMR